MIPPATNPRSCFKLSALLALLASVAVVAVATGAESPMLAAGFAPDSVQQGDRFGAVNVLSGALTIPVPIGPTYRVNEAISYGLGLTYSSSYRHWLTLPGSVPVQYVRGRSAAGWGWSLHMGRIGVNPEPPHAVSCSLNPEQGCWMYQSPDGSRHELWRVTDANACGTAFPTCYLTRDGSFLRAVLSPDPAANPVAGSNQTWRLWTPDAVEREFNHTLAKGAWTCGDPACAELDDFAGWYLTKIISPTGVAAGSVTVTYDSTRPHAIKTVWDSVRGQSSPTIEVDSDWEGTGPGVPEVNSADGGLVRRVTFSSANANGGDSVYELGYLAGVPLPDTCDANSVVVGANVPLLRTVTLLSGGVGSSSLVVTEIEYDTSSSPLPPAPGHVPSRLSVYQAATPSIRLSATYDWLCVNYNDQKDSTCSDTTTCFCSAELGKSVLGVDRRCVERQNGGTDCWDYQRSLDLDAGSSGCDPSLFPCGCPGQWDAPYGCVFSTNPWRVTVSLPEEPASVVGTRRNAEVHYFTSGCDRRKPDPGYPNGIERRVTYHDSEGSLALRTVHTEHQWDGPAREHNNMRPIRERTEFVSSARFSQVDRSDWDGAGHFRLIQEHSTEGCGVSGCLRATRADYVIEPADRNEWFLGRVTSKRVYSDWLGVGGLSQHSDFDYDQYGRLWTSIRRGLGSWPDAKTYNGWDGHEIGCEMYCGADVGSCPTVGALDRLDNCAQGGLGCGASPPGSNVAIERGYDQGVPTQVGYIGQSFLSENKEVAVSGVTTRAWDADVVPRYSREMTYDAAERATRVRFLDLTAEDERKLDLSWLSIDTLFWTRPAATGEPDIARGIKRYDAYGRQRQVRAARPWKPSLTHVDFTKDSYRGFSGNLHSESDWCESANSAEETCSASTGRTNYFDYDSFGRPGLVKHSSGEEIASFEYDGLTTIRKTTKMTPTGPQLGTVTLVQDGFGRLANVTEQLLTGGSRFTSYQYDALDRLVRIDMEVGATSQEPRLFGYDGLGNLRVSSEPERGATNYTSYDARGRLLSSEDARGTVVTRAYDCSERMVRATATLSGGGGVAESRYDFATLGSRLYQDEYQNQNGDVVNRRYTYYGPMGRLSETNTASSVSGSINHLAYFDYTDLGLLRKVTSPRGIKLLQEYDRGYLTGISEEAGDQLVSDISYDPSGARARLEFAPTAGGGPIYSDRQFDARNRLLRTNGPAGTWSSGDLAYDPSGNIFAIGSDSFSYDLQEQLLSANVAGIGFNYQYDDFGNLLQSTGTEPIANPVDPTTNRLLTPWQHSPTGSVTLAADGTEYEYDGFERMTRATTPEGVSEYLYDADGSRFLATRGSGCAADVRRTIRGPGGRILSEYLGTGTTGTCWVRDYLYAGSELIGAIQNAALRKPWVWAQLEDCPNLLFPKLHFEVADQNSCATAVRFFRRGANGCYDFNQPVGSIAEASTCPNHRAIASVTCVPGSTACTTDCYVARVVHASGEMGPPSDEFCPVNETIPFVDCNLGYAPGSGCLPDSDRDYPFVSQERPTRFFLNDHLGTPRAIVRADGSHVMDLMQLGPFGEKIVNPSCSQTRQFTGHERDDDTGLDYMMARYYGRGAGRFLVVDPAGGKPGSPQSWNPYTLALNSPVLYVDPDGRSPFKLVGVIIELTKKGYKVLSKPKTRKQLAEAVKKKKGKDVKAFSAKEAKAIGREASAGRVPVRDAPHPARDGSLDGRMPHYHLHGRPNGAGHIFYSVVAGVTAAHYAEGRGIVAEGGAFVIDFFNPLSVLQDAVDLAQTISDVGTRAIVGSDDEVEFAEGDENDEAD